jgi:hypothetical protein
MMCFGILFWFIICNKCNRHDTFIASVYENKYLTGWEKKSNALNTVTL